MPDGEALFGVGTGSMVTGCSHARNVFGLSFSTVQCTVEQDVMLFRSRPMDNCHHVLHAASGQQQRRNDSVAKLLTSGKHRGKMNIRKALSPDLPPREARVYSTCPI